LDLLLGLRQIRLRNDELAVGKSGDRLIDGFFGQDDLADWEYNAKAVVQLPPVRKGWFTYRDIEPGGIVVDVEATAFPSSIRENVTSKGSP
jgi:hypothetical protein